MSAASMENSAVADSDMQADNVEHESATQVGHGESKSDETSLGREDQKENAEQEGISKEVEPSNSGGSEAIEPRDQDVLTGRGAKVNARPGNKTFRALCFTRKPDFEDGNHATKRRIATEIFMAIKQTSGRFLRREYADGPWKEMTQDQAISKACQVMRDYKRPDRVAMREARGKRKRQRSEESTPLDGVVLPTPLDSSIDNPFGVHENDILCGRGAFVNGWIGNQRLRDLAIARKESFDAGNFTEKQALASEIVNIIRSLDPPGRFLRRPDSSRGKPLPRGLSGDWEDMSDAKSISKACQVMRDINRPDRLERDTKRKMKKEANAKDGTTTLPGSETDIKDAAQKIADDVLKGNENADEEISGAAPATTTTTATTAAATDDIAQPEKAKEPEVPVEATADSSSTIVDATVAATEQTLEEALGGSAFI